MQKCAFRIIWIFFFFFPPHWKYSEEFERMLPAISAKLKQIISFHAGGLLGLMPNQVDTAFKKQVF